MKYLPALAALLSLLACVLWIASLSEPWYHTPNNDGTEQRMGLYSSCTSKENSEHGHGHNALADAMGITAMRDQLAERRHQHQHDDDEYEHQEHRHKHERHHKHGHHEEDEEEEKGKDKGKKGYPTLQPIIIQPTLPPNINGPTAQAPMQPPPTGPGDLQVGGGGAGGGGFGPWGGAGGGGGGMPMRPTPGPTGMPADDIPASPIATPVPTSKHGHVYHDRNKHHEREHEPERESDRARDEEENDGYERMSLNQVSAGTQVPQTSQGATHEHYLKKEHGTKHEIKHNKEFPYDETWVMAMRILLILAIIVSGIAALLQLLMAWTVGQALHKGSWTTSPTTAIITTTLITLAGIHGLIVLFLFLSKRKELPHDGHFDYGYTLNIIATALSLFSPILFWYTLDTQTKYESLLGEETMAGGGRRKYASVE